jgi:hypothetical protein
MAYTLKDDDDDYDDDCESNVGDIRKCYRITKTNLTILVTTS